MKCNYNLFVRIIFLLNVLAFSNETFARQTPIPDEEYKKLRGYNFTEKRGDKWVVPQLVGENIHDQLLAEKVQSPKSKFTWKEVGRKKDKAPKGTILSQDPKEESLVSKQGLIKLIVSDGE